MKLRDLIVCGVAFVLLFGALFLLSYPGTMTNDTVGWLHRARTGQFKALQPFGAPIFFFLVDRVWPGPMSLVTFNLVVLVASLIAVFYLAFRSAWSAAVASTVVLAYPAVLTLLPVAWRDVTGLAITVATFAAAIFSAQLIADKRSSAWTLAALGIVLFVLSFVGILFRDNHAAGIFPIIAFPLSVFLLCRWNRSRALTLLLAVGISVALLVGTTLAAYRTGNEIGERRTPQAALNYYLALLSDSTNENLFPVKLYPDLTLERVRALLRSGGGNRFSVFWQAFSRGDQESLPQLKDDGDVDALRKAFERAILRHPVAFAEIRATKAIQWLDPKADFSNSSFVKHRLPPAAVKFIEIDFPHEKAAWAQKLLKSWSVWNKTPLNRNPLPLLALSVIATALAFICSLRYRILILVASASALAHFVGVIGAVAIFQFRYGHQSGFFAVLSLVFFLAGLGARLRHMTGRLPIAPEQKEGGY